ncbi:MAG: hypothetical protein KKF27_19990, partial [Gammaproteobacteria bacterium]|nr:hypothetical protein [Gammaproteobacteria bacterium]
LVNRGKKAMNDYKNEQKMLEESAKLREEYDLAKLEKEKWNDKFDKEEQAYQGDREFSNIYSSNSRDDARTVMKTNFMIIESQIDLSIPEPVFKPVSEDDEEAIKQLQAAADYVVRSNEMEEINSVTERDCKKYGTTIYKLITKKVNGKRRFEIITIHPKNVFPAAGTIDINKAEAIYHVENRTLGNCVRMYGEIAKKLPHYGLICDSDYDEVGTQYDSNVNKTIDTYNTPDNFSRSSDHPLTKYAIVEKWYIDDDGDVGLIVFSDRLILQKMPKFYHRRKYDSEVDDEGNVVNQEQSFDKEGNEEYQDQEEYDQDYEYNDKKIEKGANVEYYIPKTIPIIFQTNIPRPKCAWGISDIEINYDLDQSVKKVLHKYEERMLKGTSKIMYNKQQEEEAAQMLNNEDMQIVPVTDVNNIKVVDLTYDSPQILNFFNLMFDISQRQLGVSQVWQGFNTGEAKSGKAIDSLVKQTAEKINIKVNQKNIAYKKLYRLVCDFLLAFMDEDMPYRIDSKIQPVYGKFNRRNLLRQDESGNWIYPDWDVEISAESGFPRSRTFMFDSILELAKGGYLEPTPQNIMLWKLLTKTGYPNSEAILQSIQEQVDQMQQIQEQMSAEIPQGIPGETPQGIPGEMPGEIPQGMPAGQLDIQQIIQRLPPELQEQFLSMSEEEIMSLVGGQI